MEKLLENIGKAISTYLSRICQYYHVNTVAESIVINFFPIDMEPNFLRCRDIKVGIGQKHVFFDYLANRCQGRWRPGFQILNFHGTLPKISQT